MSASSLSYSGWPSPTGMFCATTRRRAPHESPLLRSSFMKVSMADTLATGAKKGLLGTWSQLSKPTATSPTCVMQAWNVVPYFSFSHFLATAPAATVGAVRRAELAATARVADAELLPVGVVGMTRAEGLQDVAVVLAALVGVADQQGDRRAGGLALVHATEDFHRVGLVALGHELAGAGAAAVQIGLDVGLGQGHAGRATVDHAANGRAVGFTEVGDAKQGAEGVAAHSGRIIPEGRAGSGMVLRRPAWCAHQRLSVRPGTYSSQKANGTLHALCCIATIRLHSTDRSAPCWTEPPPCSPTSNPVKPSSFAAVCATSSSTATWASPQPRTARWSRTW